MTVYGNCASNFNFTLNKFQGTYLNGIEFFTSAASLGLQLCHNNRWDGTILPMGFGLSGFGSIGTVFSTNINSAAAFKPTTNNPNLFFIDNTCTPLSLEGGTGTKFASTGGSGNQPNVEAKAEIFPNPVQNMFNIRLPELKNDLGYNIELKDISGKTIRQMAVLPGVFQLELSTDGINAGTYLVQILSGDFRQTERLVVIH
jgi:hypothetical protein